MLDPNAMGAALAAGVVAKMRAKYPPKEGTSDAIRAATDEFYATLCEGLGEALAPYLTAHAVVEVTVAPAAQGAATTATGVIR